VEENLLEIIADYIELNSENAGIAAMKNLIKVKILTIIVITHRQSHVV
jgi:septum formation topological specificity factor MinE